MTRRKLSISILLFIAMSGVGCGGGGGGPGNQNDNPDNTTENQPDKSPVVLDQTQDEAAWPNVAVADNGFAVAVWTELLAPVGEDIFGESRLVSRVFSPVDGWGEPVTLAVGGHLFSPQARIVVSSAGEFLVVWHHGGQTFATINPRVYAKVFHSASQTWADTATLSSAGRSATWPDVAMDGAGNAIAAWSEGGNGAHAAYFTGQTGNWAAPVKIQTSNNSADAVVRVSMTSTGVGAVLWTQSMGSNMSASVFSGGQFQTEIPVLELASGFIIPGRAALAAASANNIWALWVAELELFGRRYNGTGWEAPVSLGRVALTGGYPEALVDSLGRVLLVYEANDTDDPIMQNNAGALIYSNSVWNKSLLENDTQVAVRPAIGGNGNNQAAAVWHQAVDKSLMELQVRFFDGQSWSTTLHQLNNSNDADINYQHIGIDSDKNATVVYQQEKNILAVRLALP